jgi:FkbM family methyltransferase
MVAASNSMVESMDGTHLYGKAGMKQRAKRVVEAGISCLPWRSLPRRARLMLIERLCTVMEVSEQLAVIRHLAPQLGISALKANGEYGTIQSAATDTNVFATYARTGTWAKQTNDLLVAFFRKYDGGTYIDIGANIGLTTIPIAKNPKVKCFAFEPEPVNFGNLSLNIAANCFHDNVVAHEAGVLDQHCLIDLEIGEGNLGDHRVHRSDAPGDFGEQRRQIIQVPGVTLDEIIGEVDLPLAVKIDTQGAEPLVVAGGRRTLAKAELLIMEFWPYGIARLGCDPAPMIDFLEREFEEISIAPAEGDIPPEPVSSSEACSRLRAMMERDQAVVGSPYCDVIARRRGGKA